ncbi:L-lactate dehydrogenase [Mycoplasma haemofelis str. Langford 1]|uniref:L-lactate dehydrogenase n=2 Tax=Mycoplasma haemofelis TaxID=29501 RepID=F6FFI9_MYCHI|nr:L-lactate dehydrogenase [Mycoplasma haemofelis]AEG72384.1 L-lactate dehydrogenase [Mycoplasma haemofelis Ohio2]CBY92070.1 L-lactate dehydrogenase [Mycoplasma haemofelis str. Langford 1]
MAKVILIGAGAVGTSFLYSAINQGLANEYGIIDVSENGRDGNVLDLEDAIASVPKEFKIYAADYDQLDDADYILIAAGRPQKPEETRLQMVQDNVAIIKEIARKIKASKFSGITLICANPVDILTYAYLKATGFPKERVIGSGTVLDTARLRVEIAKDIGVSPNSIDNAYVIGEHGDSSVTTFSTITVGGKPLSEWGCKFTNENYEEKLERYVARKAYEIINRKRATFYGIGAGMAKILSSIVHDKGDIVVCGAYLEGEYGFSNIVMGVPCVLNKNGISKIVKIDLNSKEQEKLAASYKIIEGINKEITF